MKNLISLFLILTFLICNSVANEKIHIGFHCPSKGFDIAKRVISNEKEIIALVKNKSEILKNFTNINLAIGSDFNSYQTRVATYYEITQSTLTSFPYMPEFLLLYHVFKSGRVLKKGFSAMEGKDEPATLSKLYCKVLLKTLENYPQ